MNLPSNLRLSPSAFGQSYLLFTCVLAKAILSPLTPYLVTAKHRSRILASRPKILRGPVQAKASDSLRTSWAICPWKHSRPLRAAGQA